ncbi:hypothetical protein [Methanofollis ethanolicus]|uniref:hypothetical protein n=1 Tax=Methanofollis ethanolicus TaxID=488124 RepID=UPI001F185CA6|nr:hypothetical protein [Methanofollis ethanolicus]
MRVRRRFAHTDRACEAVSGAVLVLGLAIGTAVPGTGRGRSDATRWRGSFSAVLPTVTVRWTVPLLGYDLSGPRSLDAAREAGVFSVRCTLYVRDAGEILEEILKEL